MKDVVVTARPIELNALESFEVRTLVNFKQPRGGLRMLASRLRLPDGDLWIATLSPNVVMIGEVAIELAGEDLHGEGPTHEAATGAVAQRVANRALEAYLHLKTLGMDQFADSMVENKNESESC